MAMGQLSAPIPGRIQIYGRETRLTETDARSLTRILKRRFANGFTSRMEEKHKKGYPLTKTEANRLTRVWIRRYLYQKMGLMLLMLLGPALQAADQVAASGSLADVTTAYNAASNGDFLTIPAGSNQWASGLTIEKRLTIRGAGSNFNGTVIQVGWVGTNELDPITEAPLFLLQANSCTISNIQIRGADTDNGWMVIIKSNACRIRDTHFIKGKAAIISYADYGLVYNSTFLDCHHLFRSFANNPAARNAQYPIDDHYTSGYQRFGNTNYFVAENCVFNKTASAGFEYPVVVSSQLGGMWIVRHCEIRNAGSFGPAFDAHSAIGTSGSDGVIAFQIYSNWVSCTGSDLDKFVDHRGGQGAVYSNNLAQTWGSRPLFMRIDQNEAYYYNPGPPTTHSIYFNNYANGALLQVTVEAGDESQLVNRLDAPNGPAFLYAYYDPLVPITVGGTYSVQYPHFLREGVVHDPAQSGVHYAVEPPPHTPTKLRLKTVVIR